MSRRDLSAIVLLAVLFINSGESASTREKMASLSNWKEKLSKVLDTESQELKVLHNMLSQEESGNKSNEIGEIETSKENSDDKLTNIGSNKKKDSVSFLREEGIISKLDENSKRMDNMVLFFSDLKNLLTDAIAAQTKQMRFETEVVELREEIEFLRQEVQHIKHEQSRLALESRDSNSLEHRIHNDETTIQWLKDSTKEIRGQMNEMSKVCNATSLLHLQQNLEQQSTRQQSDLLTVQRQIETIKVEQLQQQEQIREVRGDLDDVRSWETNMGQKLVEGQFKSLGDGNDGVANSVEDEEHFLTESLKGAASFSSRHAMHSKKLKARLQEISKTSKTIAHDHFYINKRLEKLEKSHKLVQDFISNGKHKGMRKFSSADEMEKRLSGLENSMSQYALSLQNVGDRVNVVNGLQESTTQLFSTLEELETRYDEKLTEMQTNLARLDATVNTVNNTSEDLKAQQKYQNGIMKTVNKDLLQTKSQLQQNHFRIASLQTQLLKWSSQKCSVENSESVQNIRISSLESLLQLMKKEFSN